MDRLEERLRVDMFNGREDVIHSRWSLRILTVLDGKGLSGAVLRSEKDPENTNEKGYIVYQEKVQLAKAVSATSLGENPLRAAESAESPMDMWCKLNARFAANTTANKIGVLCSLLQSKYDSSKDLGDYLADLEMKFNKLSTIKLPDTEEIQVAVLLVSVSSYELLSATVAALNGTEADKLILEVVRSRLIEEQRT